MRRQSAVAFAAVLILAATALRATAPDWARPYLKTPFPMGSYITKNDDWVAVYSEVEIGITPQGGLRRSFRQVLAPTGSSDRRVSVVVVYDEALQRLVPPVIWTRGRLGYRKLNLKKAEGVDLPALGATVGSGRFLFLTTEALKAGSRAILSWEVIDKRPLFGEAVFVPFALYPVAKLRIHAEVPASGPAVQLRLVEPRADAAARIRTGDVILHRLPALDEVYDPTDPWLPAVLSALPHVVAHAGGDEHVRWESRAAEVSSRLRQVVEEDGERAWVTTAGELTGDAATAAEKVSRLVQFVQSLKYRNIAWGRGAFRPESPSETLRTMSADCKAKVVLLQALLNAIEIDSLPVLCSTGSGYQDRPAVPTLAVFDHLVLAIDLPGGDRLPGALNTGPGKGWILFDPTDPLAALGLPPADLEASYALWLDPTAGDLFPVHTREPGARSVRVTLEVALDEPDSATFHLAVEGHSEIATSLAMLKAHQEPSPILLNRCQEVLRRTVPGLSVTELDFQPPDHREHQAARLELTGRIPIPLQPVGGDIFTLASPAALLAVVLDVPALGYQRESSPDGEEVELPLGSRPYPCYQSFNHSLSGEITLTLPEGRSIVAQPEIRAIEAPWIKARVETGATWLVTLELPRGRFALESTEQRLKDLNTLAAVFRQPFLLAGRGPVRKPTGAHGQPFPSR